MFQREAGRCWEVSSDTCCRGPCLHVYLRPTPINRREEVRKSRPTHLLNGGPLRERGKSSMCVWKADSAARTVSNVGARIAYCMIALHCWCHASGSFSSPRPARCGVLLTPHSGAHVRGGQRAPQRGRDHRRPFDYRTREPHVLSGYLPYRRRTARTALQNWRHM